MIQTLLTVGGHPHEDPAAWREAAARGSGTVAVINLTLRPSDPPAPNSADLDLEGADPESWPALVEAIDDLVAAGVVPLGHVSLGYATRPLVDLIGEITRWAVMPVSGIFLDHAPAGPYQIGPVALAARIAHRAGLHTLVLNPGVPVDPLYRRLDATLCTFEGSWTEYRDWSGAGTEAGDGHLVYAVPRPDWDAARALIASRGAGLGLVTDRSGAGVEAAPLAEVAPSR